MGTNSMKLDASDRITQTMLELMGELERTKSPMKKALNFSTLIPALACLVGLAAFADAAEDWPQFQGDALRSGNAPEVALQTSLGLVAAVPLTDGIFTSPVVSAGKVFVVDGSGVVFAIDAETFESGVAVRHARRSGKLQQRLFSGGRGKVHSCGDNSGILLRTRPRQWGRC